MKALLFIALLCSVFLSTGLSAQESKVDIDFTDTPLPNILQEIKRQSDIKLAYDARNLRSIIMSVQLSDVDVKSAFDSLLIELPYEAVFIKSTWLIIPSENYVKSQSSEPKRDFKVSGRLINSQNGQALPYANVSLQGSLGGAVSNLDGYFSIPNVRSDSIPLCFSYVGFRTRCIDLREHETENMIVQLEPTNTYLLAVEVIAEQESDDLSIAPMGDMIKLDANSLSRSAATAQSDLFQSVQMLPGVSSSDILDSQLHIRGGEEDENLVLWDGFTLYHLDHFFGVFSTLNPAVIQDINLMNGPFSSRYGARSGGVLEVNGRSGNKLHPRTLIDADLIDVGLLTEGPIGEKTSYLVSFRRSHTDFIRTGFYDELLDRLFSQSVSADPESLVNEEVESDYFYDDLNIKLSHEIGEKDRLSFSLFNGGDSFERNSLYTYETQGSPFQYNDIFDDDSEWGNTGLGLTWTRNASPDKQLYTSLGYSKYSSRYEFSDTQRDFFNGIPIPEKTMTDIDENSVEDITFHHQQTHSMKSNGTLEFGYQFTLLDVENRFLENSSSNNSEVQADTSNVSIQNSLYAERRLAYGENWKLRLGGRLSTNSFNEKLYFEPRLRVDHMISPQWNVHFATGYYIQQIRRVAEQNLFLRQSDRWALSDGDSIPISKSFHSSFGLSWSSSPLTISAEVFYKDLKGVILNQEQNRLLSAFTAENEGISSGDGMVAGLDLLTTYAKGSHSAWLAYSYSFSANSLEDVNDGEEFPSAFNKPHDLKLVYNYRMRDYTVHSQLTASSGYPFTPLLGFFEGPGGDTFLVYGDDLSGRLPSQFRWDMSVSRSFTYKSSTLSLGLGVFNLTDHQNIKNRTYSINQVRDEAPEELKISTIDLELIGISPTFSISLDFR